MKVASRVALAALAVLSATPVGAQSLPAALKLPRGAIIAFKAEETNEDDFAGRHQRSVGAVEYREALTPAQNMIWVERTLRTQTGTFAGDPADLFARVPKVTYLAGARLHPLLVKDYPQIVAAIFETGPLAGASEDERAEAGLSPSRRRLFERLTPDQAAASLMLAQVLIAEPQGRALALGKPFVFPPELNRSGVRTLVFKEIDKATGLARVVLDDTLSGPAGPGASMTVSTHCDYGVDMVTGLAVEASCALGRDLVAPDGMSRKTVQQFTVSQAIVEP